MRRNGKSLRAKRMLFSQPVVLFFLIILLTFVTGMINRNFLTWNNISSIISKATSLGLVAAGVTILIISGHFDVSLGSMVGMTTCTMAILINAGVNEWLVSLIGILICVACSAINGAVSIAFKAPSFIVTLATGSVYYGIALLITKGYMQTLYGKYRFLASYKLFGIIPFLFIVLFAGFLFVHLLLKYTRTGREVYAIGTNENAAYLSGINVKASKLKFFTINGILVGLGCMVMLSRVSAAQAPSGAGMELQAIAAVVIGGSSINGGKGGVLGTFFGVILLSMISSIINMLQVSTYYEDIVYGLIVIVALAITAFRNHMMEKQGN